jgi:assimilatory nitrate reductase catalytic subunit
MGYRRRSHRASEIGRIQKTYGPGRWACWRREPHHREDLPAGQVRPGVPQDSLHRLQRPAVHGERRGRNKKAFGIDRATNPWSDMVPGRGHLGRRGQRRRVRAHHDQLRLAGARERREDHRRQDPRITPLARTCDLFLPVKPGRDIALFNGVLHLMIEKGWIDRPSSSSSPSASTRWPSTCASWNPAQDRRGNRRPRAADPPGGENVGHGQVQLPLARPRDRAPLQRRAERAGTINLVLASGRIGKPRGAATAPSWARPTARAGASTGRSATSSRAGATSQPEHRSTSPRSGASPSRTCPGPASIATRCSARSTRARSRG